MGVNRPLGIGAGSLALIAFLPREDFEAVVSANAKRYKMFNNLTADIIRELAQKSQKRGYMLSEGLFWPGVTSISVLVHDQNKNIVAAITVTAISSRFTRERQKRVAEIIKRHAGLI